MSSPGRSRKRTQKALDECSHDDNDELKSDSSEYNPDVWQMTNHHENDLNKQKKHPQAQRKKQKWMETTMLLKKQKMSKNIQKIQKESTNA